MQKYYLDVIKGNKKGFIPSLIKALLYPIGYAYALVMKIRNIFYEKGLLPCYTPPIPAVISIGNIVMGGTGKTPAVQMLAEEFYRKASLAILTRGYRSVAENAAEPLLLHGMMPETLNGVDVGDEALLHAHRFPEAYVIVNKNRVASTALAAKKGIQLMILDDAMQHRKLDRDLDIVVINAHDPFGQEQHFPRGFLRESPKALRRANLIIINHVYSQESFDALSKRVAIYTKAPCVGARLQVTGVYDLKGKQVPSEQPLKAGVFCALGNPDSFIETLHQMGVEIIDCRYAPDHTPFPADLLQHYAGTSASRGANCLICTEKDKVKLDHHISASLPIYWVQAKMKIVENKEIWDSFIAKAKNLASLYP